MVSKIYPFEYIPRVDFKMKLVIKTGYCHCHHRCQGNIDKKRVGNGQQAVQHHLIKKLVPKLLFYLHDRWRL